MGISPVTSSHSLPKRQRILKGKKKLSNVARQLEKSYASLIETEEENIGIQEKPSTTTDEINLMKKKANDQDLLMAAVKAKVCSAKSYKEKVIMLLTLKPQSWSIKQTADYFWESEYLVYQAIKQKESNGILSKSVVPGRNKI